MAHAIERTKENKSDFARLGNTKAAWHNLGQIAKDNAGYRDVQKLSNSDFTAELKCLYGDNGAKVDGWRGVFRNDTGGNLGCVPESWGGETGENIIQPSEIADLMQSLSDMGIASADCGGALHGGKQVWLVGRRADYEVTKGDVVSSYIVIRTGFDGKIASAIAETDVRVVCANTMAMVRQNSWVTARHTSKGRGKLGLTVNAIAQAHKSRLENAAKLQKLAATKVSDKEIESYLSDISGLTAKKEAAAKKLLAKKGPVISGIEGIMDAVDFSHLTPKQKSEVEEDVISRVYDQMKENVYSSPGASMAEGTAWSAYSAVTYYLTHQKGAGRAGVTKDSQFENQMWGQSANMNAMALQNALDWNQRYSKS